MVLRTHLLKKWSQCQPRLDKQLSTYPITMIAPIMGLLGGLIVAVEDWQKQKAGMSFFSSSLAVIGAI